MKRPASEILVLGFSTAARRLAETDQKVTGSNAGNALGARSFIVDRLPAARTVQPHGISGAELDRSILWDCIATDPVAPCGG
jgi:hypothetical protein